MISVGWEYEVWALNPFTDKNQRNTNQASLSGKLAYFFNSFSLYLFGVVWDF